MAPARRRPGRASPRKEGPEERRDIARLPLCGRGLEGAAATAAGEVCTGACSIPGVLPVISLMRSSVTFS